MEKTANCARDERALRSALEEHASALATLNIRVEVSETREKAALAEVDKQRMQLAELTRQRDAAQLAAAEAVHVRIAKLGEALVAVQSQVEDREKEFEAAERVTKELREALAEAGRKGRELDRIVTELRIALEESEGGAIRRATTRLKEHFRRRGVGALIRAGDRARDARAIGCSPSGNYRRALDRGPRFCRPIWVQLGHALKEQGDYTAAEAAYRRSLALDGRVKDTYLQLGHLLNLEERWEEAVEAYARADAGAEIGLLCRRFVEEGDRASDARNRPAAAHYRRALALEPDRMPIWLRLGHALGDDYGKAETAYRRAVALDRTNADTHLQLGHLLKLQARRLAAIDAYATVSRLDPELVAAREALQALIANPPSQTELAIMLNSGWEPPAAEPAPSAASAPVAADRLGLADRYGVLAADASLKAGAGHDMIWLGVHRLALAHPAATTPGHHYIWPITGARVFYISIVPSNRPTSEGRFSNNQTRRILASSKSGCACRSDASESNLPGTERGRGWRTAPGARRIDWRRTRYSRAHRAGRASRLAQGRLRGPRRDGRLRLPRPGDRLQQRGEFIGGVGSSTARQR